VEKKIVITLLDKYYNAIENENTELLFSFFEMDSTSVFFINSGVIQSSEYKNILDYYSELFNKLNNIKTWRKNEHIRFSQLTKVAIVTSENHQEAKIPDGLVSLNYQKTIVLEKITGIWKITHIHQTVTSSDIHTEVEIDELESSDIDSPDSSSTDFESVEVDTTN
jgi:hypothetical protein